MLEKSKLAWDFDNSCPQFAEGKQGLDVGKLDACIKVWQLMPAVCTNEVQCQTGLDVWQWNASIPIRQLMPAVCTNEAQGEKYLFWDKKLRELVFYTVHNSTKHPLPAFILVGWFLCWENCDIFSF